MTFYNMQSGERFVASCLRILAQHDLTLRVGYDFHQYRSLMRIARPDHTIGVPFDPDLHDFDVTQGFWIIATEPDGTTVHSQALRLLDLGEDSLADHLSDHFTDFPPPSMALDLEQSNYQAGPGASRMRGRIAYHGEFWIGGQEGQFRGSGLSTMLARYGFWMATQHWDPDHLFAFILNHVHYKGLAARTGWMHTDPAALQWYPADGRPAIETVMAYLHNDDIEYLMRLPLQVPGMAPARKTARAA